jgi:hypothetical protein
MPLANSLLSPDHPDNVQSPYPDNTGTPTPRSVQGNQIGVREITQADYDALTDAQKNEGVLYIIPASE